MSKKFLKRLIFTSQKIVHWTPVRFNLETKPPEWMQKQIASDLAGVKKGGIAAVMEKSSLVQKHKLLHFRIRNHRLRIKGYIEIERVYPITNALIFLAKKLPDMDFVLSLRDHLDRVDLGIPIFVFAKNPALASHILMPDFEACTGYRKVLQWVERGNARHLWGQKESRCLWRGGMTGGNFTLENFLTFPRSEIITESLVNPEWLDARFTDTAQCDDPKTIQPHFSAYFAPYLSIEEQIRQKYQLVLDGNSCAYSKMYWGLFSNCLVFKQKSPNIQWYYNALEPGKHLLLVEKNLLSLLKWAKAHDEEARKIAEESQSFARQNLSFPKVMQYLLTLLIEYHSL